jgi:hypothetical protein
MSEEMKEDPTSQSDPKEATDKDLQDIGRRQMMKVASLVGIAGISFGDFPIQAFAQAPPPNAPLVAGPAQSNLISKNETVLADGKETSLIFEMVGSNGVRAISKAFVKRVDLEGSYKVFSTFGVSWYPKGSSDKEPAQWVSLHSSIVDGIKGEVDGDYRKDRIRTTTIWGDGTVSQSPESVVSVRVNLQSLETMSFQDQINYMANRFKQPAVTKNQ